MLLCEMACYYACKGMTLYQVLQEMYRKYGFFKEEVISIQFEGFDASDKMAAVMKQLRAEPPAEIGFPIEKIRDYSSGLITDIATGATAPTGLPSANMLFYELAGGSKAIVRPSGTEPKVKLYLMAQGDDAAGCDSALGAIKEAMLRLVKA